MGVIYAFCTARDVLAIDAAYGKAMIREVERFGRAIPAPGPLHPVGLCHRMSSSACIERPIQYRR